MIYEPLEQVAEVWKGTTSIGRVYADNLANTLYDDDSADAENRSTTASSS